MSYKPLEDYLQGNQGTIESILKRITTTGTNSLLHNTYAHKAAVLIQQNEFTPSMKSDVSLLYFTADLVDFMHCLERREKLSGFFDDLTTSRYTYEKNKFEFHEEMMVENILYLMEHKKIIFFQMGVPDYLVAESTKKKFYCAHGLCIIMIPRKTSYDCYYINPHGNNIKTQNFYEFIMSKKRSRKIKFTEPADVVFMKALVAHINTKSDVKVNYDGSSKHTYRGANLQAGDEHGVCFIYPLIVWYYFGRYYTKTQILNTEFGKIQIATGKSLMESDKLNHFIESMFWRFCPKHFEILTHQYNLNSSHKKFSSAMEKYIAQEEFRFIKILIGPYISYIQQSTFKHNIQ